VRRFLALALVLLSGCLSLPPPDPTTRAVVGERGPAFELPRTGATPGKVTLADLTSGTTAVIVFYRGHW